MLIAEKTAIYVMPGGRDGGPRFAHDPFTHVQNLVKTRITRQPLGPGRTVENTIVDSKEVIKMRTGKNKGFTLIELLLVILIITGLAAIVVPNYMKVSDESDLAVAAANHGSLKAATRLMVLDGGLTAISGSAELNTNAGAVNFAAYDSTVYVHGPYLETVPIYSPAGTIYTVSVDAATGAITITP